MYADPKKKRLKVIKIRLNEAETNLLKTMVSLTGEQPAVLVRDLLLAKATELLSK